MSELIASIFAGIGALSWQSLVMIGIAALLFYLAIVYQYEPLLLLPIGAGALLANLPLSPLAGEDGLLTILYNAGVGNELFPLLGLSVPLTGQPQSISPVCWYPTSSAQLRSLRIVICRWCR